MVRWRVVRSHRCVGKSASPVFSSSNFGLAVGPHLMHREGEAGGLVFPDLVWACDASATAFLGQSGGLEKGPSIRPSSTSAATSSAICFQQGSTLHLRSLSKTYCLLLTRNSGMLSGTA